MPFTAPPARSKPIPTLQGVQNRVQGVFRTQPPRPSPPSHHQGPPEEPDLYTLPHISSIPEVCRSYYCTEGEEEDFHTSSRRLSNASMETALPDAEVYAPPPPPPPPLVPEVLTEDDVRAFLLVKKEEMVCEVGVWQAEVGVLQEALRQRELVVRCLEREAVEVQSMQAMQSVQTRQHSVSTASYSSSLPPVGSPLHLLTQRNGELQQELLELQRRSAHRRPIVEDDVGGRALYTSTSPAQEAEIVHLKQKVALLQEEASKQNNIISKLEAACAEFHEKSVTRTLGLESMVDENLIAQIHSLEGFVAAITNELVAKEMCIVELERSLAEAHQKSLGRVKEDEVCSRSVLEGALLGCHALLGDGVPKVVPMDITHSALLLGAEEMQERQRVAAEACEELGRCGGEAREAEVLRLCAEVQRLEGELRYTKQDCAQRSMVVEKLERSAARRKAEMAELHRRLAFASEEASHSANLAQKEANNRAKANDRVKDLEHRLQEASSKGKPAGEKVVAQMQKTIDQQKRKIEHLIAKQEHLLAPIDTLQVELHTLRELHSEVCGELEETQARHASQRSCDASAAEELQGALQEKVALVNALRGDVRVVTRQLQDSLKLQFSMSLKDSELVEVKARIDVLEGELQESQHQVRCLEAEAAGRRTKDDDVHTSAWVVAELATLQRQLADGPRLSQEELASSTSFLADLVSYVRTQKLAENGLVMPRHASKVTFKEPEDSDIKRKGLQLQQDSSLLSESPELI